MSATALDRLRPSRRQFLKAGVAGCAALTLASLAARAPAQGEASPDQGAFAFLGAQDRAIVAAIAPAMLAGALPRDAVDEVVLGVDQAIAGLAPATQEELRQLFDLLGFTIARVAVAGLWPAWEEAGVDDVAAFLERWRTSRFDLLRSAYLGLHELIVAAWYGNPRAWPRIGYPGPPELG